MGKKKTVTQTPARRCKNCMAELDAQQQTCPLCGTFNALPGAPSPLEQLADRAADAISTAAGLAAPSTPARVNVCPRCGKDLSSNPYAQFCVFCGEQLDIGSAMNKNSPSPEKSSGKASKPAKPANQVKPAPVSSTSKPARANTKPAPVIQEGIIDNRSKEGQVKMKINAGVKIVNNSCKYHCEEDCKGHNGVIVKINEIGKPEDHDHPSRTITVKIDNGELCDFAEHELELLDMQRPTATPDTGAMNAEIKLTEMPIPVQEPSKPWQASMDQGAEANEHPAQEPSKKKSKKTESARLKALDKEFASILDEIEKSRIFCTTCGNLLNSRYNIWDSEKRVIKTKCTYCSSDLDPEIWKGKVILPDDPLSLEKIIKHGTEYRKYFDRILSIDFQGDKNVSFIIGTDYHTFWAYDSIYSTKNHCWSVSKPGIAICLRPKSVVFCMRGAAWKYSRVNLYSPEKLSVLQTFECTQSAIRSISIDRNATKVLLGGYDGAEELWDATAGTLTWSAKGHAGPIDAVCFDPGNKFVASGSQDKTIKLWDISNGTLLRTFAGHEKAVISLTATVDGKFIASGSEDKKIKIWDPTTGNLVHTIEGHAGGITALVTTPDGRFLVSGSKDRTVKLWDIQAGTFIATLKEHRNSVNALAISADGTALISTSIDKHYIYHPLDAYIQLSKCLNKPKA
nr:hypothetical protein [Candidatus Sigynarchaeota archaeon]